MWINKPFNFIPTSHLRPIFLKKNVAFFQISTQEQAEYIIYKRHAPTFSSHCPNIFMLIIEICIYPEADRLQQESTSAQLHYSHQGLLTTHSNYRHQSYLQHRAEKSSMTSYSQKNKLNKKWSFLYIK